MSMAHSCPECGVLCHCGGDIDDCEFEGTRKQMQCRHCDPDDRDDDEYDEYEADSKIEDT